MKSLLPRIVFEPGVFLALLAPGPAMAQGLCESDLKAAVLVGFMKHVEWPPVHSTLTQCLREHDAVYPHLAGHHGYGINGGADQIRLPAEQDKLSGCHHAYMPGIRTERGKARIQQAFQEQVPLSWGGESFLAHGGSIAPLWNDGRYQFGVSLGALNRAGSKVGTPMLRLARRTASGDAEAR